MMAPCSLMIFRCFRNHATFRPGTIIKKTKNGPIRPEKNNPGSRLRLAMPDLDPMEELVNFQICQMNSQGSQAMLLETSLANAAIDQDRRSTD